MDNELLFYVFGSAAAVSAVVLTFAGLKLKDFPGKALPFIVVWFAFLVVGATTFSVLHAQDEEHHEAAELEHASEKLEEGKTPGPYENEGGALGGERDELEEQAEKEAEGSVEEEPVGPTEESQANKEGEQGAQGGGGQSSNEGAGSKSGAEASATTLQLAADPTQIAFDKKELSAKPGKVTIAFDNPSAVPHNVVIEKDGEELAGTDVITESKESASADLEAGSYTFVCTVPGHEDLGMVGTLTVE
ncbi:MAG TPA: plastocyanin/azurin family copper-binding protein [Solirubrobacterales bacterium]|nr:plastocyanin/azurin family copper-binding protein [Solirubrobacterales bacterium]